MFKTIIGFASFLIIFMSSSLLNLNTSIFDTINEKVSDLSINFNTNLEDSSKGISFLYTTAGGAPVLINTCEQIPVLVSSKNYKKIKPILDDIFVSIKEDLNISFKIVGTTPSVASSSWHKEGHKLLEGRKYAPIIVSLVDNHLDSDLLKSDSSAGAAATYRGKGRDSGFIVTGALAINNQILKLGTDNADFTFAKTALLHELGHIIGLGHSTNGVLKSELNLNENYLNYPLGIETFFKKYSKNCR